MDSELVGHEILRKLLKETARERSRLDGRQLSQRRPNTTVECGFVASPSSSSNVLGSAMVSHGSTLILCSISAELSPVLLSAPSKGYLDIEIVYNAATCYATGRSEAATMQPSADDRDTLWASEASTLLQKAFDQSRCVNLDALVISEGEACWALKASCVVLQDDGGVLETSAAAIRKALETARLPTEVVLPDGSKQPWAPPPSFISSSQPLLCRAAPAMATIGFIFRGGASGTSKAEPTEAQEIVILVDPTSAESFVADAFVSVAVVEKKLLCMTYHGGKPLGSELLEMLRRYAETNM